MTTCKHEDNLDYYPAACGQTQTVECLDCGITFERVKPHTVFRYLTHAEGCHHKALPAQWCKCETVKIAWCIDCEAEFPYDVAPTDGFVEVEAEPVA